MSDIATEFGSTGVMDTPTETSTGLSRPSWLDEEGGGMESTEESAKESNAASSGSEADEGDEGSAGDGGKDESQKAKTAEGEDDQSGEAEGEPTGDSKKPPKGYVEVGALKEARSTIKFHKNQVTELQAKLATLQQQIAAGPKQAHETQQQSDRFADFKELDDDDLEMLADDDPVAAAQYAKELIAYERHKANKLTDDARAAEVEEQHAIQVQIANDRIAEVLPEGDTEAETALINFAKENGFTEEFFYLTDPSLKITMQDAFGKETTMQNGVGAAVVLEMLSKMRDLATGTGNTITVDNVPEDVRKQIIEDAKSEIVGKIRNGTNKPRKVSNLSPSSRSTGDKFAGRSYRDLSPEEQEEYLKGQQ